jgi:hypothetical protein
MKNHILIITALGIWSGLTPYAGAQQPAATAGADQQPATTAGAAQQMAATMGASPMPETPQWYEVGRGIMASSPNFPAYAWTADGRDGKSTVAVMTFKTPDQGTLDETATDLNILSFIFSQNLERALGGERGEAGDFKLGIPMLLQTGGRAVEASYVEGFGALFNLKVRFPLMPPAITDKDTQTNQIDSEWDQARRALAGVTQADLRRANPYDKARRFDPKLVETLKKRVIELLRNASHLRHLQPDDWVAVTFSGPPNVIPSRGGVGSGSGGIGDVGSGTIDEQPQGTSDSSRQSAKPDEASAGPGKPNRPRRISAGAPQVPSRMTVLTIRIKKRNADALEANKMSPDDFFHAAEIANYLGPIVENGAVNDYYSAFQTR